MSRKSLASYRSLGMQGRITGGGDISMSHPAVGRPKGHGSHPVHSPSILEQMYYEIHCDETNTSRKNLVMQVSVRERGDTLKSRENRGSTWILNSSPADILR